MRGRVHNSERVLYKNKKVEHIAPAVYTALRDYDVRCIRFQLEIMRTWTVLSA